MAKRETDSASKLKFIGIRRYPGVRYYISKQRRFNGKPDKCFYIRYKNSLQKLVTEKIGWESEGISAMYAYRIRAERVRKVRLGDEVVTLQQKRKSLISFADFVKEKYLPYAESIKKRGSCVREKQLLRDWINPVIGNKAFEEITPLSLETLRNKMVEKSPRTIAYAIAIVRQVFNAAITWGIYEGTNPASKIKIKKEDNKRIRFLSEKEVKLLLGECKKRSRKAYEVVLLSLSTGLRAGEIANLKWQDIDLENKIIAVKDTKNSINRTAYITRKVYDILKNKKQGKPDDYLFPDANGNKAVDIARTIGFERIVKRLGFNDGITDRRNKVVFHSLRHTFASWLAISGVPIYTIKELMGHKTLAMTERYAHLMPNTKRAAVKNIDRIMGEHDK